MTGAPGGAGCSTGTMTIPPGENLAAARRPIAARRSSSSGSRSQPPRPTTIDASSPTSSRAHSADSRPSRTWTIRSAIEVDSGSWLTITVVHFSALASSPSTS